eukprot:NODE_9474_length_1422_cov_5.279537.p3 GENE.NODE_9474_length_1422_cov_5.279537~~NODE_9474_length_1422_cov_5.279537.p3  ORF type:complete len:119 (+),score=28.63 NODE_9474_length_1422_cov_5.279537:1031-1387(+)
MQGHTAEHGPEVVNLLLAVATLEPSPAAVLALRKDALFLTRLDRTSDGIVLLACSFSAFLLHKRQMYAYAIARSYVVVAGALFTVAARPVSYADARPHDGRGCSHDPCEVESSAQEPI